jgi:hypothetical protein
MPAEIPLQDPAVRGAVEESAPRFQFADACWCFLCVQLSHAPVVQVLAAAHGVGKVNAPAVAIIHVGHGRGYAAFCHYGVSFAEQRLRNQCDLYAGCRGLHGSAQPCAPGADNQNVMFVRDVFGH